MPQTDPASDPFVAWQASAQALSLGMDAAIVDDNGHPLGVESFAVIGSELTRLYDELAARDLAAGSARAAAVQLKPAPGTGRRGWPTIAA